MTFVTPRIQRKYVLSKIAEGDYLLPDNDGETVWRVGRYKSRWAVWKWVGGSEVVDVDAWSYWEQMFSGLKSRDAPIQKALTA